MVPRVPKGSFGYKGAKDRRCEKYLLACKLCGEPKCPVVPSQKLALEREKGTQCKKMHTPRKARDLVLIGGGHAHVQVLKMLAMKAPADVQVTLVSDSSSAFYSGMFPGCIAGLYSVEEAAIELRGLCQWAGARFINARVKNVDPETRLIECLGRPPLRFDLASINVGSSTRAMDVPGAREFAVPTRPIAGLHQKILDFEQTLSSAKTQPKIVVVGGGAAGIELAFTLRARFRRSGKEPHVTLLDSSEIPFQKQSSFTRTVLEKEFADRKIEVVIKGKAAVVTEGMLGLEDGRTIPFDLLVWATGAAAPNFLKETALACTEQGFMEVHDTLQSLSSPRVFGAGDCVSLSSYPNLPKAGVYAVREGPILTDNLLRVLEGRTPRAYVPQSGFLSLLATGDEEAILSWKGLSVRGRLAWKLKDWIDRRFMRRFDPMELGESPAKMLAMTPPSKDANEPMRCNGCGAKVGAAALREALGGLVQAPAPRVRLGLSAAEDGALIEPPPDLLQVQTVDYFPTFLDDPYLMGRIAALHSASDLFAMGAAPDTALLTLNVLASHPRRAGFELGQVVQGIVFELQKMGATLVGGHTTEALEAAIGVTMTGWVSEENVLAKGGLEEGDQLILTKGLGTGTLLAADMRYETRGIWMDEMLDSMLLSNQQAAQLAKQHQAVAVTDVTGFGLAGHLGEMARASDVGTRIELSKIPLLSGAKECLEKHIFSSLDIGNREGVRDLGVGIGGGPEEAILYDPQTSGGLLIGVHSNRVEPLLQALIGAGYTRSQVIGEVTSRPSRIDLY